MLKRISFFLPVLLILACSENKHPETAVEEQKKDSAITQPAKVKVAWRDSIIDKYINETQQALLKATENEDGGRLTIITDFQERDGINYIVSQIGRTLDDKFTTEAWFYIDSAGSKTYTYDVVNDSLILWK